jgi:hypothetical protein
MEIIGNYLVSVGKNQANRPYWPGSLQPVYDLMPKPALLYWQEGERVVIHYTCMYCLYCTVTGKCSAVKTKDSASYVFVRGGQGKKSANRKSAHSWAHSFIANPQILWLNNPQIRKFPQNTAQPFLKTALKFFFFKAFFQICTNLNKSISL